MHQHLGGLANEAETEYSARVRYDVQLNPQNSIWRDLPKLNEYVTRCQSILRTLGPWYSLTSNGVAVAENGGGTIVRV